ncbi:hypothetical protein SAMN05428957_104134 [Oryzisolibacter propanilivorax]|uniref:Uncharacterized protein n=1 Tax=Oryzisolibacter propanilivorax TaxID=1527607 RepID=A0A1G9S884_9BURK|nr:hypothetical protein [Oryzisolibacter propanilivorax]SDM30985.1 hypothetical protein SAMN05428957_104134 [Oryzisolibacter propanilivorax]
MKHRRPRHGRPAPGPAAARAAAGGAQARARLGAWLGFGPLALVVGLRWVLDWLQGRADAPPAWPLAPFVGTQDPWGWLHTTGWALMALAALLLAGRLVYRRFGARALLRLLAGLWIAAALAACAAQLAHFLNLRGLVPQPAPLAARVLGSRAVAPSLHGAGGTLLVLQLRDEPGTQQALVDDRQAAALPAGQALALHWARGRWWGRYVTGWQAVPATP